MDKNMKETERKIIERMKNRIRHLHDYTIVDVITVAKTCMFDVMSADGQFSSIVIEALQEEGARLWFVTLRNKQPVLCFEVRL